ncbi:hypothetical protein [Spirosoma foliorum]|uniref:SxtJ n=1 Tax=Spirosoma foliorum TaxID=2710596 RepID=A0A7G5H0K6_9BACT|nr:hypothetical protein [Spirosoma foliorum]QMW04648.1 hypothetical protein H3H32_06880 [Spirosoma foliorum]
MANWFSIPIIGKRQVREMGLLVIAGCLLAGLQQEQLIWYKASLVATLITLLVPWAFFPVAIIWFALGQLLGKITANVLLVLLFVVVVIPVAWLRKILGSDTFRVKEFKKSSDSVFINREHTYQASDLKYPF